MNEKLLEQCIVARQAARKLVRLTSGKKSEILCHMASQLLNDTDVILKANMEDLAKAKSNGMSAHMLDRLSLEEKRIQAMADGIRDVADLEDPIGRVDHMTKRPNGLLIGKKRTPFGVIAIIYEARPNVTSDAAALCFKTSNAVILRGGKEAFCSNMAVIASLRKALKAYDLENAVSLVKDTSRETAKELMCANGYVDLLIPRGGAGLIQTVVSTATVPVIETGIGNCHIYVEESADFEMAKNIIINAKTSRPSVCNAAESLVVDEAIADRFLPYLIPFFQEAGVRLLGCEKSCAIGKGVIEHAAEEDFGCEFLGLTMSVKLVSGIDEAIDHINYYSTGHSEAIITNNYEKSQRFLEEIDSAAVYVNASTRFTDGGEFGFGAEIGISTQKLHARGPMGLDELTTTKYVIYGNGQIR
jgi:glutamate-5-semialdehyde dehydrogenase